MKLGFEWGENKAKANLKKPSAAEPQTNLGVSRKDAKAAKVGEYG